MKRKGLIVATLVLLTIHVHAQEEETETRAFQLSLVPQLGTNKQPAGSVTHNISINLLAGFNGGVQGIEVGGFANVDRHDVVGAQLAGFVNGIGGDVSGFQGAGFVNYAQAARGGLQLSGFTNIAKSAVEGAQASGFMNYAGSTTGVQVAGFTNVNSEVMTGVQISGFANYAREASGLQVAGFANHATRLRGVQIGIINIADTVEKGATIGVINIVRKGMHKFEFEYNDVTDFNLSFKGGTHTLYSILTAGYKSGSNDYWSSGFGLGTQFNHKHNLYSSIELSTHYLQKKGDEFEDLNLLSKVHLNVGYNFLPGVSVNGGPVLNIYVTDHTPGETQPIELVKKPFYEKTVDTTNVQLWIGYRVGIRF